MSDQDRNILISAFAQVQFQLQSWRKVSIKPTTLVLISRELGHINRNSPKARYRKLALALSVLIIRFEVSVLNEDMGIAEAAWNKLRVLQGDLNVLPFEELPPLELTWTD